MLIFYVLLAFVLIAALIAVETKDLLSSVICLGAAGFGGALMFLFLYAPDIAITQVVVEVLSLIILIRVTLSRDITTISGEREFFAVVVSVVLLASVFLAGTQIFTQFPEFGAPLFATASPETHASQYYVQNGLEQTGAANAVAAIILDYRGYDTLGEATVLFTSILGASVLLRKKARIGREDRP